MTKKTYPLKCSICGEKIPPQLPSGWRGGHNAEPVKSGRCCDLCNDMIVIPTRMARMGLLRSRGEDNT
jgi:hypothetical protein